MDRKVLILAVYGPTALLAFAQGAIVLALPLLANDVSDAYSFASFIVAAAALGTLLADVPTGTVMIRLGLRRTMLIGSVVVALSTFMLAAPLRSDLLLVARLFAGVGTALWGLSRYTFITQQVPPELRGRTIASFGGINRVGVFAGPLLAGWLITAWDLRAAFLLAGGLATLACVAAFLWIPADATVKSESPGDASHSGELVGTWRAIAGRRADVLFASVGQVLAQVVRQGRHFLIPLYGVEVLNLDAFQVGLVMTTSAVIDMSLFGPAGYLMDRFGRKFAIIPSFSLMAVGLAMIPFTDGLGGLLFAGVVIGLGNGLGSGTMMTLGADFAPPGYTSTFLSVWRFIGDTGQMLGPIMVGVVAQAFTLRQSAWVLALCSAACALMLYFLVRETRVDSHPSAAQPAVAGQDVKLQNQGG